MNELRRQFQDEYTHLVGSRHLEHQFRGTDCERTLVRQCHISSRDTIVGTAGDQTERFRVV